MGTLSANHKVSYHLHKPHTGVYFFIIEGNVDIADENLTRSDGIGIWDTESIIIKTNEESQVLAIEVAL